MTKTEKKKILSKFPVIFFFFPVRRKWKLFWSKAVADKIEREKWKNLSVWKSEKSNFLYLRIHIFCSLYIIKSGIMQIVKFIGWII